MLFHSPPDNFPWQNYDNEALSLIFKEGKVKAFGVSCKSYKGAINCMENRFGQVIEVIYNVLDRRIENKVLPLAEKYEYDVIIKAPLLHGMVEKKSSRSEFIIGDHRLNFTDREYNWINNARKKLSFLDELPGGIIVSALRFVMAPKQNTIVVPGVHKKEHINMIRQAMLLGPLDNKYIKIKNKTLPKTYLGWE
jgi:aryl-alcohol dehydrogenase-like predicted oxidoreductase